MTITKEVKSKHEQFLSFCDLISCISGYNKVAIIINIPIAILLSIAILYQTYLFGLLTTGIEYSSLLKIIDIICSSFITILVIFSITYHYAVNNFFCNKDKRNCYANIFCGYIILPFVPSGTFFLFALTRSNHINENILIHNIIACVPLFLYVYLMIPAILYYIFALFYYTSCGIYLCCMKLTNNYNCNEFCNEIKRDIDQNGVYYEEKNI